MTTVLLTGITGLVGPHVAIALLEAGYRVKATVRGGKIDALRTSLGSHYPLLELVKVDNLATADLSETLNGVNAIIHIAKPSLGSKGPPETLFDETVKAIMNVLRQAVKANINKVVLTSGMMSMINPGQWNVFFEGKTFKSDDWGHVTREEAIKGSPDMMSVVYAGNLTGEKEAWKLAHNNPSLDLTTILPPWIFGPYVPHFPLPASPKQLGTNGLLYMLLDLTNPDVITPLFCDVRDVAKAHILALKTPPLSHSEIEKKRILISGGHLIRQDAAKYLLETRPEVIKSRIVDPELFHPLPGKLSTIDTSGAKELLGMNEWIGWRKTLDDTVDAFLDLERSWA